MAVDKWPDEEGYIMEGECVGFAEAGAATTEGRGVKFGTAATGKVVVTVAAAIGDSFGVACKAVDSGKKLPVAVGGIYKMVSTGTFAVGEFVMGGAAGRAQIGDATANTSNLQIFKAAGSAGSYVLGLALQTATTEGDEVLVLLKGGL